MNPFSPNAPRLNELHRDDVRRAALRQQLIRTAERRHHRRLFLKGDLTTALHIGAVIFLVLVLVTLTALPAAAQTADMIEPGNNEPYHPALVNYRVGIFHQVRGEHERAIEEFTTTIEGLPTLAVAWAARGDSLTALGDYAAAVDDYTAAIEQDELLASAWAMRGNAYAALEMRELARVDYQTALAYAPDYALPYLGLSALYDAEGDTVAAQAQYEIYVALQTAASDAGNVIES